MKLDVIKLDGKKAGSVDLGDYDGTGYIAFRYNGNGNNGNTTTYAIDNIVIE